MEAQMSELSFIRNPAEWPRWPALPVVLRERTPDGLLCGLVIAGQGPVVIVRANLFEIAERPGETWQEKLKGFDRWTYDSFEELIQKWRID
jgi:hypothetical protein